MADNIFSGARAEVYCGTTKVGRAQNLSGSYNIANVLLEELGEAVPTEVVTVGSNVTFSIGKISEIGQSMVEAGLIPAMETDALISMPYLTFTCVDRVTGKPKFSILDCKPDGAQSFGGNPRSLFVEGMNFVGKKIEFYKGNE